MANAIDNGCADGLSALEMCSGDCVAVRHASPPPFFIPRSHTRSRAQVNKIREIPQHPELVVTHADSPEVFLWNMDKQPSRSREKVRERPDSDLFLVLSVESQRENFSPHLGRHSTPSLLHTYYLVRVPPKPATLTAPLTSVLSDTRRRPSSLWPPPTWHPSSRAEETTSWCVGSSVG